MVLTACAAAPPAARVVPTPGVDTDDGLVDVTVRLPGVVHRGTSVEVFVLVEGRKGIATYDESAIDFTMNGHGLRNARITPIGGEVRPLTFQGYGGTILARGHRFGPGSRLGFTATFDIASDTPMRELLYQVHASVSGGAPSGSFVRNYVAAVE